MIFVLSVVSLFCICVVTHLTLYLIDFNRKQEKHVERRLEELERDIYKINRNINYMSDPAFKREHKFLQRQLKRNIERLERNQQWP